MYIKNAMDWFDHSPINLMVGSTPFILLIGTLLNSFCHVAVQKRHRQYTSTISRTVDNLSNATNLRNIHVTNHSVAQS